MIDPHSSFPLTKDTTFEIKSLSAEGLFQGLASTYHTDREQDTIMPGAFLSTLKKWRLQKKWPPLLWHHHLDQPIGFWHQIKETTEGLFVTGELLLSVSKAKEVYTLLKKGIVESLSIGFKPIVSKYDPLTQSRKIFQVDLFEISIVSLPANPYARISDVKSLRA